VSKKATDRRAYARKPKSSHCCCCCCCCCCCYVVYGFGWVTIQPGLFLGLKLISSFGKSICTIHAGPGRSAGFVTGGVWGEGWVVKPGVVYSMQ
jgi:hypothetical protein